jgi:hypothetical protein
MGKIKCFYIIILTIGIAIFFIGLWNLFQTSSYLNTPNYGIIYHINYSIVLPLFGVMLIIVSTLQIIFIKQIVEKIQDLRDELYDSKRELNVKLDNITKKINN